MQVEDWRTKIRPLYIIRRIYCQDDNCSFHNEAYCTDRYYAKRKVIIDLKRQYLEEHPYMKYDPVQEIMYGVHPIHGYYTVKWDIAREELIECNIKVVNDLQHF